MDNIVVFEGDDLETLKQDLLRMLGAGDYTGAYRLRFAIDEGGLKMKVNEFAWTRAMGKLAE